MKLGSFWGLTAPMFVMAFTDKNDAIPFFDEMRKYSNKEALQGLQKELLFLKKQIEQLRTMKCTISLEEVQDDVWIAGNGLRDNPEYNAIVKNAITQECIVRCYVREKANHFKELTKLNELVDEALNTWNGAVNQRAQVVGSIVRKLPNGTKACIADWLHENGIQMSYDIVDSINTDFGIYTLSEDEKRVLSYFNTRFDDIQFWVERLTFSSIKSEEVYGMPFTVFMQRNPKSIRYAVLSRFDTIKNINDRKTLLDRCDSVRRDTERFKQLYFQYAQTANERTSRLRGLTAPSVMLHSILPNGFKYEELPEDDRILLNRICERCSKMTGSYMESLLGVHTEDWDAFGQQLLNVGVYGINNRQMGLLQESIANTILSPNKYYVKEEDMAEVVHILDDDILAMLDSILPVGEVLS